MLKSDIQQQKALFAMQCLANDYPGCIPISMPTTPVGQKPFVESLDPAYWISLVTPPKQEGGIFGFAEFVQAFALLVLIYTLSDVRYRFRVETAPIHLFRTTFWLAGFIGVGTLVSDVWFAQQYAMPLLLANRTLWQAFFGLLFLALIMMWLWFAFLNPPIFGKRNAVKYKSSLYKYLLQGTESDLPIIADELEQSAISIIECAGRIPHQETGAANKRPSTARIANDLLLLIGNRKFCRHIVASAPNTAIAFFKAMSDLKKYQLPIGQFASNISTEALINKDSILYHEDDTYYSGYFSYIRPFSNAVYGDFRLVESLAAYKSPLDMDLDMAFDARQLEAYARVTLVTFESALNAGQWGQHSYALYRAFNLIERSCADLYQLNTIPAPSNADDIRGRLGIVVDFINSAIEILDKHGVKPTTLRRRGERQRQQADLYDHLAEMMFEAISSASSLDGPGLENWTIQYGAVWSKFFGPNGSGARGIILFKLRRLLYEEILKLERLPNFVSAPIFGLCLNVMGLTVGRKRDRAGGEYQLRKVVVSWARRNYLSLVRRRQEVAAACLVGTITFDLEKKRLVKTYRKGLRSEALADYLDLQDEHSETVEQSKK